MKLSVQAVIVLSLLFVLPNYASVYQLPSEHSKLIGEKLTYKIEKGDYFQAIAEYHDVGILALLAANPHVDPFLPLKGDILSIPKQMLLPFAERVGMVVNLAELRLYYFPPNESFVYVFPVGIGRQGLSTPRTITYIGDKRKDPVWKPTAEMRERYKLEKGVELAKEVPAGPDNPFGRYAMRLDTSEYLIHGTNQRVGVGMRASSGCIRMYAEDIEWLYHNVEVGTQVRIVNQPIKMSYEPNGEKLIEVHQPLSEEPENLMTTAVDKFIGEDNVVRNNFLEHIKKPTGLVVGLKYMRN